MTRKIFCYSVLIGACVGLGSAEPLIKNGEFEKPLAPWKLFSIKDTPATDRAVADGVLTIKAADASGKPGNRQLIQEVAVEAGRTYSLSFDIKGDLEKGKEVVVVVTTGPGKFAYFNRVPITADWTSKKLRITPKETDGTDAPTLKFLLGDLKGDVSLRKVSLEATE
ncbi:glucan endo-1,3-beta-D-glucosidase [Haloferula helveola]|uniref:Glucan endo-1,3-beta-D-glucosidase n=1 Tax=Haloferula helveola TaxID=490095 RepID=A0ABN6HBE1_9BACT|nr:glucan endo-1,3-beta-D-glucosidase [Haloferula helveola]